MNLTFNGSEYSINPNPKLRDILKLLARSRAKRANILKSEDKLGADCIGTATTITDNNNNAPT